MVKRKNKEPFSSEDEAWRSYLENPSMDLKIVASDEVSIYSKVHIWWVWHNTDLFTKLKHGPEHEYVQYYTDSTILAIALRCHYNKACQI